MADLSFDDLIPRNANAPTGEPTFDDLIPAQGVAPDLSAQYNTPLSPSDEYHFNQWAQKSGKAGDVENYDLRGAWLSNADPAENGHLPDTFKKPNHPTFSAESEYSNPQTQGGEWTQDEGGQWAFAPSPYNLQTYGGDNLQQYFKQNEPDSRLALVPPDGSGAGHSNAIQAPGGVAGSVDAFGRGVANMAMMGFGDEIGAAARYAGGKVLPWQSNVTYEQALDEVRNSDKQVADQHPVADAAGQVTGAVGSAAGLGQAGLSFAGRAIDNGGRLANVVRGSALDGMILGGISGAGNANGDLADRRDGAVEGGIGGLAIGGALPVGMAAAGGLARRVISPFVTNPERTRAAQALANEGVDLTAGQRTGSDRLRYAESEIGGRTAANMMERQGEQFTSAALRRTGTTADRATPEVVDQTFGRIGADFDNLATRNTLLPDAQLASDLGGVRQNYFSMVPESQRAPVVMEMITDIGNTLNQGPLDGAAYQAARSRLDRAARSSASDPQLQEALYGIRNSLDDGMERSIAASNPSDSGAWRTARRQYRNALVIEKAITGAGENAAQGLISPAQLRNATVQQGRRSYARGQGDFAELARSGEATMKPLPNSGTAGRLNAQNMGSGLVGMMGMGGAGYASGGDPSMMMAGAAAGYALPKIAGRALMTGPVQTYLGNQAAQAARLSPQMQKLLNMIMNVEGSQEAPSVGRTLLAR